MKYTIYKEYKTSGYAWTLDPHRERLWQEMGGYTR